jgi:hypothetical protein
VSVALGTLSSALNEFSRLKGPEISPDGMLGGVGYILPIREIKQTLNTSIHNLGNVADCVADELNNPRWNVKDDKEVKKLIKEKEDVEEKVEEQQQEMPEPENDEIIPDDIVTVTDIKLAGERAIREVLSSAIRQKLTKRS